VKISIVTTIYRTAEFLDRSDQECLAALRDSMTTICYDCERLADDWRAAVSTLKARDTRLTIIELSRNFGHHAAIWCSLEHATGDLVFLIDSDLEVAPAILSDLNCKLQADPDPNVVYAYQSERSGGLQTALFGRVFWRI
jgi:putative glycosyltransferase